MGIGQTTLVGRGYNDVAMCGRFSLIADIGELQDRFDFDGEGLEYAPRFNMAPTQEVLIVVGGESRRGGYMRWGLIPPWTKDLSTGRPMINARAETVAERPAFRNALRRRRCLVLADGFYEWQRVRHAKKPMRVVMRSGEPFAFAGLWERWRNPDGQVIPSCTIITTEANALLRPIHNRMPVILSREMDRFWLDRSVQDPAAIGSILSPYPADAMELYEVSTLVNSYANDGPEIIEPVPYS